MDILIVDDSRAIQAIIRHAIAQAGWDELNIHTVYSGVAALEHVESSPPDLILTDWHMPGMSGLEMLQTIRQLGHRELPVCFLTSETHTDRIEEAKRNGAGFILHKPFTAEDLHQQLHPLVSEIKARTAKPSVVNAAGLTALLEDMLPGTPFRLTAQAMTAQHLTTKNLLALYRPSASSGIAALAVMDQPCVTLLGTATAAAPLQSTQPNTAAAVTTDPLQVATHLLSQAASLLNVSDTDGLIMHKHSIVSREFAKLHELFARNNGFASFRLTVPGHGTGNLAFFVV